jgi:SnoaL-like domain
MATGLSRDELVDIRFSLEDLNSAFARHLDHGELDALVELFTTDALYTHGPRRSEGRDEIRALFVNRTARGPRTSRHLYSGLRFDIADRNHATGASVCLSFAQDGSPPLPATPFLVADFDDVYVRCEDGVWRFEERHISRVFVGSQLAGFGQAAQ